MLRAPSTAPRGQAAGKRPKAGLVRSLLAVCMAAGFSALSPQASAQDYRSDAWGGVGGAAFSLRCAQGDYLVGLRGRAGDWLDAIAPLCARWDVEEQRFLPPGLGPMRGGQGGAAHETACNDRSALTSLLIEISPDGHRNVAMLLAYCTDVATLEETNNRRTLDYFGTTLADRTAAADGLGTTFHTRHDLSQLLKCHDGDFAVGIHGGAGAYIDRIGLICAPRPQVRRPIIVMPPVPPAPTRPGPTPVEAGANVPMPGQIPVPVQRPARCREGYVWREAQIPDFVCVTPQARDLARAENAAAPSRIDPNGAYGPSSCRSGYVWRDAFDGDFVCVTPTRRAQVREENRLSPQFEAR